MISPRQAKLTLAAANLVAMGILGAVALGLWLLGVPYALGVLTGAGLYLVVLHYKEKELAEALASAKVARRKI